MSTNPAEVSVIVPVFNGEKYLAQCIQSVLDQHHQAMEVLVVDNASFDSTADIARSFPLVRYCYLPEKGLVNALNYGIEQCRGEFVAFLDSDDMWTPGKLDLQLAEFHNDPTIDMVFGHVEQFISPELDETLRSALQVRKSELPGYFRGTLIVRKSSLMKAGLFDASSDYGDFIDWYMRAQDQGLKEILLPDVLTRRRIHETNMGRTDKSRRVDFARALKRGLDRRRRMGKA